MYFKKNILVANRPLKCISFYGFLCFFFKEENEEKHLHFGDK